MRKRTLCPLLLCLAIIIAAFFGVYTAIEYLQSYSNAQEQKVREWQKEHELPKDLDDSEGGPEIVGVPLEDDGAPEVVKEPEQPSDGGPKVPEEEPEQPVAPKVHVYSTPTTTPSTSTTTQRILEEDWTTRTIPTTSTTSEAPTTTTEAPTPPPTPPSTSTTSEAPRTFPTRRPYPYNPDRHRYGQDRLFPHQQHHHHHHHHHHHSSTTTTTEAPTTTMPSTTTPPPTTTTTRIRITTSRYHYQPSSPSFERITIPAAPRVPAIPIPTESSYRNQYIHKIEVTSSTYKTPDRHHGHHHHNRTHIEIHRHHHLQYPYPYPGVEVPRDLYPTTTTERSTSPPEVVTTERRHHHGHHQGHHGHHHHYHHSTTTTTPPTTTSPTTTTHRPTPTTTTRQSELDKWGFVEESVEDDVKEEEDEDSTTTSTTTTTTTEAPSPPPPPAPAPLPERPGRPRHRQPEPTQAPVKRVERETTLVTGFLDIGRGEWDIYRRPLETYHQFMETLLTLENNFVVFTDESSYDFVVRTRTKLGLMDRTKVYKITLDDLPLYSYINEARKIIADELSNETFYRTVADLDMKTHPESMSAEYNIVVNSKTFFLHNVTLENPFNSEHFVWLDAGYGHANENHFPYSYLWKPALPDGKISLIKITPEFDSVSHYDLKKLYRKNVALLSGGFIAGDKHSIGQLHSIIHRKFIQLIYQNHVDDDQTLLTLAVNAHPHLFHIVQGGWFDAFRLFASDPEVQLG